MAFTEIDMLTGIVTVFAERNIVKEYRGSYNVELFDLLPWAQMVSSDATVYLVVPKDQAFGLQSGANGGAGVSEMPNYRMSMEYVRRAPMPMVPDSDASAGVYGVHFYNEV